MSEMMDNFHFLQPAWLSALLLLPLVFWWVGLRRDGRKQMARVVDARLLAHVVDSAGVGARLAPWLASLCWLLACLAMAGPSWQRLPAPALQSQHARIIVLSLADSMLAGDLEPNRLTRARFKVRQLLQHGGDAHVGLVAYAGEAFVVAPLTADEATVRNFLSALKPGVMPVDGDRADRGIEQAVKLLQQAGKQQGDIILVADHAGEQAVRVARQARQAGFDVSVLGVASDHDQPVRLSDGQLLKDSKGNIVVPSRGLEQLREVAAAGGGDYQSFAVGRGDVDALLKSTEKTVAADQPGDQKVQRWRDAGPWLLLVLLPLLALGFRRGWLVVIMLGFVVPSSPVQAAPPWWDSLWRNKDQRAAHALASGKPELARKTAQSTELRGAGAYRSGDFDAAGEQFAKGDSAEAKYNLGNALARQGKYQQALQAWQQALDADPNLQDARANRQSVLDWLKKQRSQQGGQSNEQSGSGSGQGQSGQGQSGQGQSGQGQSGQGQSGQQGQSSQGKVQNGNDGRQQGKNGQQGNEQAAEPSQGGNKQTDARPDKQAEPAAGKDSAGSSNATKDATPASTATSPSKAASQPSGSAGKSDASSAHGGPARQATRPGDKQHGADEAQMDGKQQARQQRRIEAAREALDKTLDKKLKQQGEGSVHYLGVEQPTDLTNLPPDMQRALEEVPEDPGGLLRRKFRLEYMQRQRGDQ